MAIKIQQLSDYGTSSPIVARLSIQTKDLIPFFEISDCKRAEIFSVFFANIQPKLMACDRIKESLTKEVLTHQKSIDDCGLKIQAHGNSYTLPAILDLEHRVEAFLYNAKSVLRDLTQVFLILFDKNFKRKARFDEVLKWGKDTFGNEDEYVEMLEKDQKWIKRIVDMRNAVEHPGDHAGSLLIDNFTSIEQEQEILFIEPRWQFNDREKIPIIQEMNVIVSDLLTFCEETLIINIERFKKPFPIKIVEIPEAERDPACPVRFKAGIDAEIFCP